MPISSFADVKKALTKGWGKDYSFFFYGINVSITRYDDVAKNIYISLWYIQSCQVVIVVSKMKFNSRMDSQY